MTTFNLNLIIKLIRINAAKHLIKWVKKVELRKLKINHLIDKLLAH